MRGRHRPHGVLGAQHWPHDVDLHQPGQRILVLLLDVRLLADGTGVVDQRGERPHLLLRPAEHGLDLILRGNIGTHRHGPAARASDGRHHRLRPVGVGRVVHDHAIAITGQPLSDSGANAPAGASYDHRALVLYSRSHVNHPLMYRRALFARANGAIRPRLPCLRQPALSAMLARRPDGTDRAVGPQVFLCRGCSDGMATPEMGRTRTARRLQCR